MLIIRLKKIALNKNSSYSIIVIPEMKAANSNQFLEKIGYHKPLVDKLDNKYTFLDLTRFSFWIKRGAFIHKSLYSLIKGLIIYTTNIKQKVILLPDIFFIGIFTLFNNI